VIVMKSLFYGKANLQTVILLLWDMRLA